MTSSTSVLQDTRSDTKLTRSCIAPNCSATPTHFAVLTCPTRSRRGLLCSEHTMQILEQRRNWTRDVSAALDAIFHDKHVTLRCPLCAGNISHFDCVVTPL